MRHHRRDYVGKVWNDSENGHRNNEVSSAETRKIFKQPIIRYTRHCLIENGDSFYQRIPAVSP